MFCAERRAIYKVYSVSVEVLVYIIIARPLTPVVKGRAIIIRSRERAWKSRLEVTR